ncbi:MAG TPA: VOC family protein [Myxococcota bacterium]|jgi:hypothetical protein|nr:VOC family protein [Myxococcota bacterium]
MASPFVHVEISSRDLERAKLFFGQVFGWTYQVSMPNYAVIQSGLKPGDYGCAGAVMPVPVGMPGPTVTVYVQVDDVDAALGRVAAAGGQVLGQKMEVPGYGWFAPFRDLDGNVMCVWKAAAPPPPAAAPPKKAASRARAGAAARKPAPKAKQKAKGKKGRR